MSLFQIPDYSENISGQVRVLLKIIGLGWVSGTRLTLDIIRRLINIVSDGNLNIRAPWKSKFWDTLITVLSEQARVSLLSLSLSYPGNSPVWTSIGSFPVESGTLIHLETPENQGFSFSNKSPACRGFLKPPSELLWKFIRFGCVRHPL